MKTYFDGPFENSLFSGPEWKNKSVMAIVPHQDDELNLTGATIRNLLDHHIRVRVVFLTNSDRFEPGVLRVREGMASCKALGVPDEDVIFLGYCNTFRIHKDLQFYNADSDDIVVPSTRHLTETYGPPEKPEFCYLQHGVHHTYTRRHFRDDIKDVILTYHPDVIFANDFDRHPDHRAFSLLFEEAIASILHTPGNTYHPEVYKGFCYNGSFLGKRDFYAALNLLGEVRAEGSFSNNPAFDTDYPPYDWEKRVRLPVPKGVLSRTLNGSSLYPSIRAHFSQGLLHNAKRMLNSDQIFWRRRTDSLTYGATVTASSGDASVLTDFKLADCPDVLALPAVLKGGTWIPAADDEKKEVHIAFAEPKTVSQVILYGNADTENRVLQGRITLSNGFCREFGPLREGAKATPIEFEPQTAITEITITLTKLQGAEAGLNEIEIYAAKEAPTLLHFIKILVDDTFAYDYWLTDTKDITLWLYTCGPDGVQVHTDTIPDGYTWTVEQGNNVELTGNHVHFGSGFRSAVIRVARADDPSIYDQIVLRRKNAVEIAMLKVVQGIDVAMNRIEHVKKHRYYKKHIQEKDPDVGKLPD